MLTIALLAAIYPVAAQPPAAPGRSWRAAPGHLALFTPPRYRGAYAAFVSDQSLENALAAVTADPAAVRTPGSWEPARLAVADAFGPPGQYDRWLLARLYGARGPRVARGAIARGGRDVESWTLISPYPDATLRRLEPGTLLLVLRVP